MWERDLTLYRRTYKYNLLPQFFAPILYLLSIGLGLGRYLGSEIGGVPYVQYIAPGLAAMAAMNGVVFELTFNLYGKLQFARLYDAVIATPLEPEDVAVGELLWALTRCMIYVVGFLVVMAMFGDLTSFSGALLALISLPLVGIVFGLIALIYTCIVPSIDFFTYFFVFFYTPLFLFSGIFFPIENLPAAAEYAAFLSPLYHGVEMTRRFALGGDMGTALLHAAILVGFSLILFPPAINLMRRRLVV